MWGERGTRPHCCVLSNVWMWSWGNDCIFICCLSSETIPEKTGSRQSKMGRVARLLSELWADCDPPTLFLCVCVVFWKPLWKAANFLDPPVRRQAFLTEEKLSSTQAGAFWPQQLFRTKHLGLRCSIQSEHIEFGKKVGAEDSSSSVLGLKGKWNDGEGRLLEEKLQRAPTGVDVNRGSATSVSSLTFLCLISPVWKTGMWYVELWYVEKV